MDFKFILDEIQKADPEVYERLSPRRQIFKSFGSKVAVAALPFAIGSMFKKAYGKTTDTVIDALNFALELEFLEFNFYHAFNNLATLTIPAADKPAFTTIEANEQAHVTFLRNAIHNAGGTPYTPTGYTADAVNGSAIFPDAYDFTGGSGSMTGPYLAALTDYDTFLTVSQTFEDTGVRAYKGQAGNLMSNGTVLTNALQIHSVEARHAAHIRLIRRRRPAADAPKPWITGNNAPIAAVNATYATEDNTAQLTVGITGLKGADGATNISYNVATESFDEPLAKEAVVAIVTPFFKS